MKKSLLLLCLAIVLTANSQAQKTSEHQLKTSIKEIVAFLDGAEITRTVSLNFKEGRHSLIFTGLSPKLLPQSVRVTTNEDIAVLAISSKTDYLSKETVSPRIKALKDSVKLIEDQINQQESLLDAYTIEKDLLKENQELGGDNTGVSVESIQKAAEFYRTRITDINRKYYASQVKLKKLRETLTRVNNELQELNAQRTYSRATVTILLSAPKDIRTDVEIKYLVRQAGWSPNYDIRATELNKPVELVYRANVYNNTNIDWEDVKLTLSTADPYKSAAQPQLKPWHLNYTDPGSGAWNMQQGYIQNAAPAMNLGRGENTLNWETAEGESTGEIKFRDVEVSELSAEFEIKDPYTIPSDDKPYLVDVSKHELPATYKHFAVPKMERDAFLLARITGWEELNLVEGPANVYLGGSYVGESYIYTRNVKDTLDLSLGRDSKVLVTRTKLKEYSSTKLIGSKRKETYAYAMVVKNNRKAPITIDILDQLPLSQNEEIEVKSIEISEADYDENTGQLNWAFKLDPGQTRKIMLTFSIKYPKNTTVPVKQSQKRQMRAF